MSAAKLADPFGLGPRRSEGSESVKPQTNRRQSIERGLEDLVMQQYNEMLESQTAADQPPTPARALSDSLSNSLSPRSTLSEYFMKRQPSIDTAPLPRYPFDDIIGAKQQEVAKPSIEVTPVEPLRKLSEMSDELEEPDPLSRSICEYTTPTLPRGQELVFNIQSTWGDKHYVGLTGIEVRSMIFIKQPPLKLRF